MGMLGRLCYVAAFGTNPAIVYTTEVARPELRGSLISVGPFMVSLGEWCRCHRALSGVARRFRLGNQTAPNSRGH